MKYNNFLEDGYIILDIPKNKMATFNQVKKMLQDKTKKYLQIHKNENFDLKKFHKFKLKKKI